MNLMELRDRIEKIIESTKEYEVDPFDIGVSIQIDGDSGFCVWAFDEIEVSFDNGGMVSGCVISGWKDEIV